jgi:hypothetical protein
MEQTMTYQEQLEAALRELVDAIGKKRDGETPARRANAISPRMEEAIAAAKKLIGNQ